MNVNTELFLNVSDMPSWHLGSKMPKKIVVNFIKFQAFSVFSMDRIVSSTSTFESKDIKLGK